MTLILTCKIGKFTFEEGTPLSLAKLVRDTVMGQMLAPKSRERIIDNEDDAYAFIRSSDSALISRVAFELELSDHVKTHIFESRIKALAAQASVTSNEISALSKAFNVTFEEAKRVFRYYTALSAQGIYA